MEHAATTIAPLNSMEGRGQGGLAQAPRPRRACRDAALNGLAVPTRVHAECRHVVDALEAPSPQARPSGCASWPARTHFAIGPAGGHASFETAKLLDQLCDDLGKSEVRVNQTLSGGGNKALSAHKRLEGRWFRGDVIFLINRSAPAGSGRRAASLTPNELWIEHWRPETRRPTSLAVRTARPVAGRTMLRSWRTWSLSEGPNSDRFLAAIYCRSAQSPRQRRLRALRRDCGFGRAVTTTTIATRTMTTMPLRIDFTRYQRSSPTFNRSGGTPVLAPRGGSSASSPMHAERQ